MLQVYTAKHVREVADYEKAMIAWRARMVAAGHGNFIEKVVPTPKSVNEAMTVASPASTDAKKSIFNFITKLFR